MAAKPKHPPGPPMTLGNTRERGVRGLGYVLPPSTGDEKRRKKKGHSQGKELRPKFFPASHGGLGGMGNDRTKNLMPQTRRGSIEVSPKW